MLKVMLTINEKSLSLGDVKPGESGSITDYADNSLVIFTCNKQDDGAELSRSMYGCHIEQGDKREIVSGNLVKWAVIPTNGEYSLEITTKHGQAIISFSHEEKPCMTH